jgi:hypothetical protein
METGSGYGLLLPSGMLDYFEIVKVEEKSSEIIISLEEKNNINASFSSSRYESKGFYPLVEVVDFPVRRKKLLLHIRRRRWIDKQTGKYHDRDFHLIAEGARITQEFAFFLKGIHR